MATRIEEIIEINFSEFLKKLIDMLCIIMSESRMRIYIDMARL